MLRHCVAVLTCLALLVPSGVSAQSQLQIAVSGYGGAAIPAGNLVDYFETTPLSARITASHKTGWTAGGRIAVWPSSRLGFEVEAGYISSEVEAESFIPDADEPIDTATTSAGIFSGSVNVLYAVINPPLDPLAIHVSGGIGVVSRGGGFYTGLANSTKTDVAYVFGAGLRYGLAPGWRLRLDVKDYISKFKYQELSDFLESVCDEFSCLAGLDSQWQNEITITAGIEVFFSPGN